jgi:hypothetical protein
MRGTGDSGQRGQSAMVRERVCGGSQPMPQVHECEQCGKIIAQSGDYLEVEIVPEDPKKMPHNGRIHAACLEEFRKKHPRD